MYPWQRVPRYVSATGPAAVAEMKPPPPVEPLPPVERFGAEHRCNTVSCACCARWQNAYDRLQRLMLTLEDILADRRDAELPSRATVQHQPHGFVTPDHQREVMRNFGGNP